MDRYGHCEEREERRYPSQQHEVSRARSRSPLRARDNRGYEVIYAQPRVSDSGSGSIYRQYRSDRSPAHSPGIGPSIPRVSRPPTRDDEYDLHDALLRDNDNDYLRRLADGGNVSLSACNAIPPGSDVDVIPATSQALLPQVPDGMIACSIGNCTAYFPNRSVLNRHKNEVHPSRATFHCRVDMSTCDRTFHNLYSLETHEHKTHGGPVERECPKCHKKFKWLSSHLSNKYSIDVENMKCDEIHRLGS